MNSNQLFDYGVSFSSGKVRCTPLYKGSIHNITCSSCTCAPLFALHFPFPVSSLRALVHSQQYLFPSHPPCSDWNLCLAYSIIPYAHYNYIQHDQNVYQADHYFIPVHQCVSLRLIIYVMVSYWTRSHSFIRFLGCGNTVLLPNKSSGREVQLLALLYPTVRLSPWRHVH